MTVGDLTWLIPPAGLALVAWLAVTNPARPRPGAKSSPLPTPAQETSK